MTRPHAATVRPATLDDIEGLTRCFDAYRVFYGQVSDIGGAAAFLTERIAHRDSTILVALREHAVVGFVQLYPSFTSVGMRRIMILNDLYVHVSARGEGIARALMAGAEDVARAAGCARLSLTTARDNAAAQRLYRDLGYVRDDVFRAYHKTVAAAPTTRARRGRDGRPVGTARSTAGADPARRWRRR